MKKSEGKESYCVQMLPFEKTTVQESDRTMINRMSTVGYKESLVSKRDILYGNKD